MSKQLKARVSALAMSCVAVLVDAFTHAASVAAIVSAERESTSGMIRDALFAMRDGAADTGAYLTACEDVYGNGLRHTAKDYKGGLLREKLTDAKVEMDTVKVYMAQARAVAAWLADPDHNKARVLPNGEALSLGALYKLAKLAKAPVANVANVAANVPDAPAAPAAPESLSQIIAKFGIVNVLNECAAIMRTASKTKTDAIAIETIAKRVA